jgi:hypothetical protein
MLTLKFALARQFTFQEFRPMYGPIGKIRCVPGQRDALAAILIEGSSAMPGCRSGLADAKAG